MNEHDAMMAIFTGLAMQALLQGNPCYSENPKELAARAIVIADEVAAQLEEYLGPTVRYQ